MGHGHGHKKKTSQPIPESTINKLKKKQNTTMNGLRRLDKSNMDKGYKKAVNLSQLLLQKVDEVHARFPDKKEKDTINHEIENENETKQ
eukprot:347635_1